MKSNIYLKKKKMPQIENIITVSEINGNINEIKLKR